MSAQSRLRISWWAVMVVVVTFVAAFLVKLPEFFLPMGEDQGIFNYAGQLIVRGGVLYRDFFETKPPAEYVFHGLVIAPLVDPWAACWIGRYQSTCGEIVLHLSDLVYSWLTALAIYGLARRDLSARFALAAAMLTAISINGVLLNQLGNIPEKHAILPITLAVWAYRVGLTSARAFRWLTLAGALVGVGFLFKQPAAMTGAVLALHALWSIRSLKAIAPFSALALGFALSLLPLAVWLLATNNFADFWGQVVVFNLEQAASHTERFEAKLSERVWWVFTQANGLLWTLAAIGSLLALWTRRDRRDFSLWLLWSAASAVAVLWGGSKLVQSYFLWLVPPFALLAGYALQRLWAYVGRTEYRLLLAAVCLLGFLATSDFQRIVVLRVLKERWPERVLLSPEERVVNAIPQGGSLYIWGGSTQIYILSHSTPPSRHLHAFTLSLAESSFPSYQARREELIRDLRAKPPQLILVSPVTRSNDPDGSQGTDLSTFPDLTGFLAERYGPSYRPVPDLAWEAYQLRG